MRRARALLLTIGLAACGRDSATPTLPSPTPTTTISAVARQYLEQVLTIMQTNSINRLTLDWTTVRAQAFEAAAAAQTIPETYPGIRSALARIADDHSSYRGADGTVVAVRLRSCTGSGGPARPASLPPNIGYVSVGGFSGTAAEATTFANNIQAVIRGDDRDGLSGWMVDLRGNGGGNMWPMIAGLGPVLGEGLLGYFISPTGATSSWEFRDGASYSGGNVIQRVDNPYRVRRERPRVAVLSDTAVASSGEATLIAFRQRPDTRSFGLPSCGLSTANTPYSLSDGAILNLTTAVMADSTQTRYGDQVQPDEVIADRTELVNRAIAWLQTGH